MYGYCRVPLLDLAQGLRIENSFPIESSDGKSCGSLCIKLWWENPYEGLEKPMISLLDDDTIKEELNEANAIIKETPRKEEQLISVQVLKLELDAKDSELSTKQIFIGVEICGFTNETMESSSLLLENNGIIDNINFETSE